MQKPIDITKIEGSINQLSDLHTAAKYQELIAQAKAIISLLVDNNKEQTAAYLETCIWLGAGYTMLSKFKEAETYLFEHTKSLSSTSNEYEPSILQSCLYWQTKYYQVIANVPAINSKLEELTELSTKLYGKNSIKYAAVLLLKAQFQTLKNEHQAALESLSYAKRIYTKQNIQKDLTYCELLVKSALTYTYLSDKKSSAEQVETAYQIASRITHPEHPIFIDIYIWKGFEYGLKSDTGKYLQYGQKALQICLRTFEMFSTETLRSYRNLSDIYIPLGKVKEALETAEKALTIAEHVFPPNHPSLAGAYQTLGAALYQSRAYEQAKVILLKGLEILKEHPKLYLSSNRQIHHFLSHCCYRLNDLDGHLEHAKQYNKINVLLYGEQNEAVANSSLMIGQNYLLREKYDEFLKYCNISLGIVLNKPLSENRYQLPDISNYKNPFTLRTCLKYRAFAFYNLFKQNKQTKDIQAAKAGFQQLLDHLDKERLSYQSEQSKLFLSRFSEGIFEYSLMTAYEMQDLSFAFNVFERSKAVLLLDDFTQKDANTDDTVSIDLLKEEVILDKQYQQLKLKIAQLKSQNSELVEIGKTQNKAFNIKIQLDELRLKIEKEHPEYAAKKRALSVVSFEEAKRKLQENQVLVSYFISTTYYYILVIDEYEESFLQLETPAELTTCLTDFSASINQHDKNSFTQNSRQLAKWLLDPIADFLFDPFDDTIHKDLIFLPYGELNYIPFESLLLEDEHSSNDYQDYSFLIKSCEVQYHYSATLWLKTLTKSNKQRIENESFVGFAPLYQFEEEDEQQSELESSPNWRPLPHSTKEIHNVAAMFEEQKRSSTQIFLEAQANKPNFLKNAIDKKYILIAAHGVVNDKLPELSGLVFYPKDAQGNLLPLDEHLLSMREAAQIELSADLVVLSSCESGIGELSKGNGLLSINRGFIQAGVSNIVFTLFKVYDEPSSQLIQNFFHFVLDGHSYTAALRKAKLDFLKGGMADPKMWCSYVLIGV